MNINQEQLPLLKKITDSLGFDTLTEIKRLNFAYDNDDINLLQRIVDVGGYELYDKALSAIESHPDCTDSIIDSFSANQLLSKNELISQIKLLDTSFEEIFIWGSWYGSLLIPGLRHICERFTCVELDDVANRIARDFFGARNIKYITDDTFNRNLNGYAENNNSLIINTSCEHMPPMNTWKYWHKVKRGAYVAFQSNDMYGIEGHTNCVDTLDDFIKQMPNEIKIMHTDEIADTRGTRFMIIGIVK